MMVKAMKLVFSLFMLVEITVCNDVFKLVNSSVQLDIQKVTGTHDLNWKFNKTANIVFLYKNETKVYRNYKGRVEFNKETLSLTLKNLQKEDSGIYEAVAVGDNLETVATYKLEVLDPVEKPTLNDALQKNNKTCKVTLLCEAQNLSVTSHCSRNNCDKKEATSEFLSLSLYVSERVIICNHSNPVSWKITTMKIKPVEELCLSEDKISKPTGIVKVVAVFVVIIIIIIIIGIFYQWKKRRTKTLILLDISTCYEDVAPSKTGVEKRQSIERSTSHESPATLYCTVGMPDSKDESPVSIDQEAEKIHNTETINSPQTVYATVNKVDKLA